MPKTRPRSQPLPSITSQLRALWAQRWVTASCYCNAQLTVVAKVYLFYITSDNRLASRQFLSGTWATRDNFSPSASGNISFSVQTDSRALAVSNKENGSAHGGLYVFYVASNGSAVCLSIDMGSDSISASPGPVLPSSLNRGHVLALAAGEAFVGRPQVGVRMSNGTVYYDLFFYFLEQGSWTQPQRKI